MRMQISAINNPYLAKLHQLPSTKPAAEAIENLNSAGCEIDIALTEKPWLTEPGLECIDTMDEYISFKQMDAHISLGIMKAHHDAFIDKLRSTHPELANKSFSFTINDQGDFEIVDPENNLSSNDVEYLTQHNSPSKCVSETLSERP